MIINLIYDDAALNTAPQSFRDGVQAAADMLEDHFVDNITVNINVSYGTFAGTALPNQNTSEGNIGAGGDGVGTTESYSDLRNLLVTFATSANDTTSVNNLPTGSSIDGQSSFVIGTAQAKALGLVSATDPTGDGQIGMGTNFTGDVLFAGALHELAHAMGRIAGISLDLFRFNEDGSLHHVFGGAIPATSAYFSIDGGATEIADFGISSDPGDFLNGGVQGLDPFNENVSGAPAQLTTADATLMDVLGFDFVNTAPTVAALFGSVGEDASSFSKDLLTGAADPEDDSISVKHLATSLTTTGGRTLTLNTDYTLSGSTLSLTATGFAKFDSLAQGVNDTAVFHYDVEDYFGADTANTLTLTINGLNDTPVLSADSGSPHPLTELAGTTGSVSLDQVSGTLSFTDVDVGDTHTASASLNSATWSGGATIPSASQTALSSAMSASISLDGTAGTLGWQFSLADKNVDFLAVGETLTAVYDVTVTDNHSASSTKQVTVTFTGTNDVPVIVAAQSTLNGSISELPNVTGSSAIDSTAGAVAFSDPDLNDLPTATIDTADQTATWQDVSNVYTLSPAQIALFDAAIQISPEVGNTNTGKIDWTYSIVDKNLDFLSVGESVTVTTPVVIDDHNGGTVTQDVVVTINGANDNPIAAPDSNGTAKNTTLTVSAANGVLANDTDPDIHDQGHLFVSDVNGSAAKVGQAVAGTYGTLTLNADGSYVYAANRGSLPAQLVAQDTFNYTVADGHGGTDTSTLSIVVFGPGVSYQSGINTTLTGGNGKNVLDGSAGNDILIGGNAPDVLIGGKGDTLTGGKGPDTFLFRPNFGADTITDFDVHNDVIQFNVALFANFAAVMADTTQVGAATSIKFDANNSVTLDNVTASSLSSSNFHFA